MTIRQKKQKPAEKQHSTHPYAPTSPTHYHRPHAMSNSLDGLFQILEDTFENSGKDVEIAGKSAHRITDGVKTLLSSFDEHEVRACASVLSSEPL